jgi:exonuclease III
MSTPQQIFAARAMSEDRFRDLRSILQRAAQAPTVLTAQAADTCTPNSLMPDNQLTTWFDQQAAQWRRLTTGVRVDK